MEENKFLFDVFLSHSAKDKDIVREIAEQLKSNGLRVWFDEWEIKPPDHIPTKIEEGLEYSRKLLLFMSANAFGSDWATLESQTFRFKDPLNRSGRFISIRLDNAPIKGSLVQFSHINWATGQRNQEYEKLLEAIRQPENQRQILNVNKPDYAFRHSETGFTLPINQRGFNNRIELSRVDLEKLQSYIRMPLSLWREGLVEKVIHISTPLSL